MECAQEAIYCAPSMGAFLRVQVPPRVGHSERSEAQLHEGDRVWEGSVERKLRADGQEPDKKGDTEQGEQAIICKALVTKAKWRKSGGCAMKECDPLPGEISPHA